MIIDEKDLTPIVANELKEGFTFYIKQDNGEFERSICDPGFQSNRGHLAAYRQWIVKLSKAGKLFRRRDKAFQDFRDVEQYNGIKR